MAKHVHDPSERASRASARLIAGTRRAVRPSGPPTDEIPVWTPPDGVDTVTARAVIDLAMRAGVAMLATGAGAADVNSTVLLLTRAYGLRSVHVDVTYTSIGVSHHRGPDADPVTVLRAVVTRTQDYTRLERLRNLVLSLVADPIDVHEAKIRFDAIVSAPHPYRRWVVTLASALLTAAVAVLIGGGWLVTIVSFVSAVLIDRTQHALSKVGVAPFFSQVVAAAIPSLGATAVVYAGLKGSTIAGQASPSLVVASGIVLLLSGLSVVGAAEDALGGYYVTAGARAFEVVVQTMGIAIGVTLVLTIGNRTGLYIAVSSAASFTSRNLLVQLACAAVISAMFAISAYAVGRATLMSAVMGAVGWWISSTLQIHDIGAASSGAAAAALIGFLSRLWARRLRMSALAVTVASIVPLLPGLTVYQGISQIIAEPGAVGLGKGLPSLAGAAGIGLGLAAGVSLGTYLARVLSAWRHGTRLTPAPGTARSTRPRDPT
ncbi:MAG: threonine/serine exporter family protein [Nostocoides sp.]